jgi:hypothetical protein
MKGLIFCLACVAFFGGVFVQAVPINFPEVGDFNDNQNFPTSIAPGLDVGVNIISGAVSTQNFQIDRSDSFELSNPLGLAITAITIDITNYVDNRTNTSNSTGFREFGVLPWYQVHNIDGNGNFVMGNINYETPSSFVLDVYAEDFDHEGVSFDWQVNVTAADVSTPIPEPSTYLLFTVGILGFIGVGYIRRQKAARK